jgi:tetratricopeptide (TPR) repeat protein
MKKKYFLSIVLLLILTVNGVCQENIFMLLKNEATLADEYFEKKNFKSALQLYLKAAKKNEPSKDITLQIARCYYFLKQYDLAVAAYEKYAGAAYKLPETDLFYFAEAQAGMANYKKAIASYREYLSQNPGNELIIKKIWRLNNVHFLYEDSSHYAVRPISINTDYGELCPVSFRGGIVFMSNRGEVRLVDYVNASLNTPFYRIYYANKFSDSIMSSEILHYDKPSIFSDELNFKYHTGPASFYGESRKMVFAASGGENNKGEGRTLQLYFAEELGGEWKVTGSYLYNSLSYSISEPAISEDGKLLFFSSDMEGGFGGKDLYSSEYINGEWTSPVNLGENINTAHDEVFPYLHLNKTLYFSSNGHAGLGGLDIFKVEINKDGIGEVQNPGYPLNTNFDDFGIVIDSLSTHGYLTSNRQKGGFNDDIFEFDMDVQTYPLEISGIIKYIEHNWVDSSELKILPHAKLYLIDNIKKVTVAESISDSTGSFTIVVPYFSQYKIRIAGETINEGIVSFEVPKYRKLNNKYEIVVVKDDFKSYEKKPDVK